MYKEFLKKIVKNKPLFSTEICYIRRKTNEIDLNKDKLFYEFLKNNEIIQEFELKLEEPILDTNTFNINNAFYDAFEKMKQDIEWNNYSFSKIVYIKLYQFSKRLRKKIIKFSLLNLKRVSEVIESYNPIYNQSKTKHNWEKNPKESYEIYYQIMIKKTNSLNNEKVKYNLIKKEIGEKSEIVILTRDKFDKKNLIFNGKLCNVYVQNELSRRKKEGNSLNSDIMNNYQNKKEIIFSLLNTPKFLNKYEKEKEEKEKELSQKFINDEKELFNNKYNKNIKKEKSFNFINSITNETKFNTINTTSRNINSKLFNTSKFKFKTNDNFRKKLLISKKYFKNYSQQKKKKIPKLKEFLLNKSDFYY